MSRLRVAAALLTSLALALPALAASTFADVVNNSIVPLFDKGVIPLLYALAFLFLIFGIFRYFFTGGAENRETARVFIVWALVGMVLLFSVWGILKLLLSTIPVS